MGPNLEGVMTVRHLPRRVWETPGNLRRKGYHLSYIHVTDCQRSFFSSYHKKAAGARALLVRTIVLCSLGGSRNRNEVQILIPGFCEDAEKQNDLEELINFPGGNFLPRVREVFPFPSPSCSWYGLLPWRPANTSSQGKLPC